MIPRNRLAVITNAAQGRDPKVLCVCAGGVLRSPTAAWILSNAPFGFNTRSCGDKDYALIPLSQELVGWADEIVVMDTWHADSVRGFLLQAIGEGNRNSWPKIHVLNIEDDYDFKQPELITEMTEKLTTIFLKVTDEQLL